MSTQSLERTLPHNIDAEKSVLGSILVNNENYYRVIETLRPEDFYLDAHRVIYRKMVELIERSRAIDLITIQEELVRASQLESAGGITYLAGLLDGIPHLVNIEHYIEIIREKSLLRQMVNSANKIMADCFEQANIAQAVALNKNLPVGMFSLEMSKEQLLMRMLCAEARVDAHRVRTGYLGKDDFRKLIDSLGRTTQAPIFIDDSSTLTVMEMRAKCRRLKAEHGLSLIIVDYLQLMSGYGRVENRTQEISSISRGLK